MNKDTTPHSKISNAEPLLVTEPEACQMLRLGRTTLFHLRRTGAIRSVLVKTRKGNVSGRRMYPVEALRAYVESLTTANP
jgi:hypothetical protein